MTAARTSAWSVPLMWLVVGLLVATVAAGFATLFIAIDARDATGVDAVRRTGQQQTFDVAPDVAAARRGVAATLTLGARGAIALVLAQAAPATLELTLVHPADAARDRHVALRRDGAGRYVGSSDALSAGAWNLVLAPPDRAWRLVGRLDAGAARVALAPRFGPGP